MNALIVAQDQGITFEAMETLPRHLEAAFTEIRRRAQGNDKLMRAMIKAQHALTYIEHWFDRQQVFHMESATTPGKTYAVDVLGHCTCPAQSLCYHQVAREACVLAGSLASLEAWDYVRAQDGAQIWRTTTGFLAMFDGTFVVHATQPCEARATLLDYQVGLLEHELVHTVVPTHDVPVRIVNGMHSAFFAALADAGLPTTRDVVAERRARVAQAAVLVVVERAA